CGRPPRPARRRRRCRDRGHGSARCAGTSHPCSRRRRGRPARPTAGNRQGGWHCGDIRQGSSCAPPSDRQVGGDTEMPAADFHEERIALGDPYRREMADGPDEETDQPEAQAEAHGPGQRPVEDRDRARRTAEQDVLGQRAVNRDGESRHVQLLEGDRHQTSAPPPNEKNDRKKLDAAKAIERPKTIWNSLRKPPDVSPKASARPVAMMMMTAMILATGPSID